MEEENGYVDGCRGREERVKKITWMDRKIRKIVDCTRTRNDEVGKIQKEKTSAYAYHSSKILNPYLVGRHNDTFSQSVVVTAAIMLMS